MTAEDTTVRLKGGQTTDDYKLDRVVQFDEKSRDYPIRALVGAQKPRSYSWACSVTLDQGSEGACVGFGWTHEKAAKPVPVSGMTNALALDTYHLAQTLDEWPGESYSGTSVLAGVKAGQQQGYYGEYRWAFGLDDVVLSLGYRGPVVLGIPWYDGMYTPVLKDSDYWVSVTGAKVGGHCILARAVNVQQRFVVLHNSWGSDWGRNGDARIGFDDLDRLLHEDGEACIPVERKRP